MTDNIWKMVRDKNIVTTKSNRKSCGLSYVANINDFSDLFSDSHISENIDYQLQYSWPVISIVTQNWKTSWSHLSYCTISDDLEWLQGHTPNVSHLMQFLVQLSSVLLPSVLWRCWLGGRKAIWPVKTEWWGTGVVICLERGANDLHMVQLMPLPSHHLLLQ